MTKTLITGFEDVGAYPSQSIGAIYKNLDRNHRAAREAGWEVFHMDARRGPCDHAKEVGTESFLSSTSHIGLRFSNDRSWAQKSDVSRLQAMINVLRTSVSNAKAHLEDREVMWLDADAFVKHPESVFTERCPHGLKAYEERWHWQDLVQSGSMQVKRKELTNSVMRARGDKGLKMLELYQSLLHFYSIHKPLENFTFTEFGPKMLERMRSLSCSDNDKSFEIVDNSHEVYCHSVTQEEARWRDSPALVKEINSKHVAFINMSPSTVEDVSPFYDYLVGEYR